MTWDFEIVTTQTNQYFSIYLGICNNMQVIWGDGDVSSILTNELPLTVTHWYVDPGTYNISISGGTCTNLEIYESNLVTKIHNIIPNFNLSSVNMFLRGAKITSIPEGLFDNNSNISVFRLAFINCTYLTGIPINLFESFKNNINDFSNTFDGCISLVGKAPEIWELYTPELSSKGKDCFKDCINLENYKSIPISWGGPVYYHQKKYAERYFVYHNIRHDGTNIEADKLYSILAPQTTSTRVLPDNNILPYNIKPLTEYETKNPTKGPDPIMWSIVDKTNKYPIVTLDENVNSNLANYFLSKLPPIDVNSRNGLSKPFSMILKNVYFKHRYFLTHPTNVALPNQPALSGRWIYSRRPAFTTYTITLSTIDYDFSYNILNDNIVYDYAFSLDLHNQDLIIYEESGDVIHVNLSGIDTYVSDTTALSTAFITSKKTILEPFHSINIADGNPDSDMTYDYAPRDGVMMTQYNIAVPCQVKYPSPDLWKTCVNIYQINRLSGLDITPNYSLIVPGNHFGYQPGLSLSYKKIKKSYELLAISINTKDDNTIAYLYENSIVYKLSGTDVEEISGVPFLNNWHYMQEVSLKNVDQSSDAHGGYFGYDIEIQTHKNIRWPLLYISEPFYNNGTVHVYSLLSEENEPNTWKHMEWISAPEGQENFGYSLASSGPYICISAPQNNGCNINLYKVSLKKDVDGEPLLSIILTDTLFIESNTGNCGKYVSINSNYTTTLPGDRKYHNFYGDHLAVSDDDYTRIYSIHFDKLEPLCEIPGSTMVKLDKNLAVRVNNDSNIIEMNVARQI